MTERMEGEPGGGRPALELHRPEGEWAHPAGRADGVSELVLSADPATGDRTVLQRYAPGVDTSAGGIISHPYVEEVYVLDGALTDLTLGATFEEGSYAYRPVGMPHGPYASPGGCLMLVVMRHT